MSPEIMILMRLGLAGILVGTALIDAVRLVKPFIVLTAPIKKEGEDAEKVVDIYEAEEEETPAAEVEELTLAEEEAIIESSQEMAKDEEVKAKIEESLAKCDALMADVEASESQQSETNVVVEEPMAGPEGPPLSSPEKDQYFQIETVQTVPSPIVEVVDSPKPVVPTPSPAAQPPPRRSGRRQY